MGEEKAPSKAKVLDQLADPHLTKTLLKYAGLLTGSEPAAEDLLSDAILHVCDEQGGRPWDPSRGSLCAHMRIVLRDLAHDKRRSAQARREVLEPGFALDESTETPHPAPDEALSHARDLERLRRWGAILREELVRDHPLAAQVFDHACQEEIDDAGELSAKLGCTTKEICEANRQIARAAVRVRAAQGKVEAARLREWRERSRKRQAT